MTDYSNQTELETKNNQQKAAGYYLILSLFLLLLSFFILLNSISNITEVKSRAVMNSLLSTFRTEVSSQSAQT
ncbi:MAG: flagellar motor protein MotB, partial [Pseudomonadota bacterium]|nr:flagellar motor protein MotB [Pseudomonadota bacterium]